MTCLDQHIATRVDAWRAAGSGFGPRVLRARGVTVPGSGRTAGILGEASYCPQTSARRAKEPQHG
jgi:hypothetical protein